MYGVKTPFLERYLNKDARVAFARAHTSRIVLLGTLKMRKSFCSRKSRVL